jgi:hypothetical protein
MLKNAPGMFVAIALMLLSCVQFARADLLQELIPDAQKYGEARFKVLVLSIYDLSLYTQNGVYDKNKPLALKLNYLTSLKKESIIKQTVKAMTRRKMGSAAEIEKWTGIMEDHFDDVEKHDRILIAFPDPQTVVFSTNDSPPEKVVDRGFAVAFKDLWLGDNIRNKAFQKELLGLK